ncbi:MAG: 23S rRNA (adenine(2503)-C(2))-methyltransferase RlmN [Candidatus Cloacimonadales bacterium]
MQHFLELDPADLNALLLQLVNRQYRVKQINNWLFQQLENDISKMSNLPKSLRQSLAAELDTVLPKIISQQISSDGTSKFLLQLVDASQIEMVLMPAAKKNTLCLSSQVGCARACQFCATATLGWQRNLQVSEILAQVYLAKQFLGEQKLTNLVFMGMGEPLDNLANVIRAIKILQHEQTFSFSPRRITVSTSGIIPGIKQLAASGLKVKLAVSLNAALESKRDILMPVNRLYPLSELKKALLDFRRETNFRITFEYVMIKNFNMDEEDIKAIKRFLGDISCKINLIAWNAVEGLPYEAPDTAEIEKFSTALQVLSAAVTQRKSRGNDIAAACGQLAAQAKKEK